MTQLDRIVAILERDRRIDNFYANHNRINLRLGARIWDLRQQGASSGRRRGRTEHGISCDRVSEGEAASNDGMTSISDILRDFAEVHGTESEKRAWLPGRILAFSEELVAEIEAKIVPEPTFAGAQYNNALHETAAIIRRALGL
jgi:hypothetical protein